MQRGVSTHKCFYTLHGWEWKKSKVVDFKNQQRQCLDFVYCVCCCWLLHLDDKQITKQIRSCGNWIAASYENVLNYSSNIFNLMDLGN